MEPGSVIEEVRRVFGDAGQVAERVQEEAHREALESAIEAPADDRVTAAVRQERRRAVDLGVSGLAKVAEGRDDEVSSAEAFGMEAIVLLEGRPALLVQRGDFPAPPPEWGQLENERDAVRSVISRVGRVEVTGHVSLDWVGTAFLVAERSIMTNRHVAVEFSRRDSGDSWVFAQGMSSRLDFREELLGGTPLEFEITDVIGIHETHDLALLRVESVRGDGQCLPEPLAVAASEPVDVENRDVYVVGYPAWDGRRNDPSEMQRIFMDIFNVKRLQPGRTFASFGGQTVLHHDCSTLGGNSGSPVVDLEDHRVIGLHFGGRYLVGNSAVPLWMLAGDPLLQAGGVNFQ